MTPPEAQVAKTDPPPAVEKPAAKAKPEAKLKEKRAKANVAVVTTESDDRSAEVIFEYIKSDCDFPKTKLS